MLILGWSYFQMMSTLLSLMVAKLQLESIIIYVYCDSKVLAKITRDTVFEWCLPGKGRLSVK